MSVNVAYDTPRGVTTRANVYWAILVVVTVLVEATWLGLIRVQGVMPDLVLLLVVYFGINRGEERAMTTGLVGGVLQDVAGDTGLGHHVLCLVIIGFLVGQISHRLITDNPAVKTGVVFCASIIHAIIYVMVDYVQTPDIDALNMLAVSHVPRAFYTALATPLVFYILNRIHWLANVSRGGAS
jgi:rod shape-determining protein MreD